MPGCSGLSDTAARTFPRPLATSVSLNPDGEAFDVGGRRHRACAGNWCRKMTGQDQSEKSCPLKVSVRLDCSLPPVNVLSHGYTRMNYNQIEVNMAGGARVQQT